MPDGILLGCFGFFWYFALVLETGVPELGGDAPTQREHALIPVTKRINGESEGWGEDSPSSARSVTCAV